MSGFLSGRTSLTTVNTSDIAANAIDGTLTKDALIGDYSDVTITAADLIIYGDATDSNNTKRDTVQGILDLAGGGLKFISSTDISSAATFDFTAVDASAYDGYVLFLMNVIPVTDATYIWLRTSTDGGSSYDTSSAYGWGADGMDGGGGWDDQQSSQDQIALNGDAAADNRRIGSAAGEDGVSGTIHVHGPHLAKETFVTWNLAMTNANGDGAPNTVTGGGKRKSSADVDAFRILFSSGSIESGTISVFGVKNS